jgi:hypothetical protein
MIKKIKKKLKKFEKKKEKGEILQRSGLDWTLCQRKPRSQQSLNLLLHLQEPIYKRPFSPVSILFLTEFLKKFEFHLRLGFFWFGLLFSWVVIHSFFNSLLLCSIVALLPLHVLQTLYIGLFSFWSLRL